MPTASHWPLRWPGCGRPLTSSRSRLSATSRWCARLWDTAPWPICSKPFTFAAFRDRLERYQRYRDALPAGSDAASQAEVDRALAELRVSSDRAAAPKGAASGTNDEIARSVRDSADGVTADEVARQVGASRVTAWRYLVRLADEGTVSRTPTTASRPAQTRYQWR